MSHPPRIFRNWARLFAGLRELAASATLVLCAWGAAAAAQTCTVGTAGVAFGTYDGQAATANESSGHVDVSCTCSGGDCVDFSYTIELQPGGSGSTSNRWMTRSGGTETLNYGLFQDSSRVVPWGLDPNSMTNLYTANLFSSFQRSPVYGRIPAAQHVVPGTYADTVGVVITY